MIGHKKKRSPNFYSRNSDKNSDPESEGDCEEVRKRIRALFKTFYNYTDNNNPFGDPELSKPFFWKKKIQKLKKMGLEPKSDSQTIILKLKICKKEIERTRVRRLEREEMKEKIDLEKNKSLKEKEEQNYEEWKAKDEKFHLAQEKLRTEIRIKQGRVKPVDFINKVALIWRSLYKIPNDFFDIPEYQKPYLLYELLDEEGLKELYSELRTQLAIDQERLANKKFVCFYIDIASNFKQYHDLNEQDLEAFIKYWQAMIIIIESYIYPEKNIKNLGKELREEIEGLLNEKTFEELDELEDEITNKMDDQVMSSDIQFWSNVLYNLRIYRCKMVLDNLYIDFVNNNTEHLESLKKMAKTTLANVDRNSVIKYEEEGCLSPVMYESDEELRKLSICEHDYLIKIVESRKLLLADQMSKLQKQALKDRNDKIIQAREAADREKEKEKPISSNRQVAQTASLVKPSLTQKEKEMKLKIFEEAIANSKDEVLEVISENEEGEEVEDEKKKSDDSDAEMEKFLSKKGKKPVPKSSEVYNKNQVDLLLGTVCYPVNTLKASRFYLKEDDMYDFNLSHEMKEIESQELGEGESIFNEIIPLSSNYLWGSKYKPRKPRYFNRVRTGYEWNKYNQAHYDYDNPPPKVIQGYKFNVFYPDLIDKTKSPQYSLDRSDTTDTCILKFHAGPPYEDIAFKIVNREWDMTEKAGFKNVFDRGILYLYFNFKRYRYKR